ncbi:MAG: DUF4476 domain-containing protein [Deltaproteobacteria bacterium]|nr:DUF4476 domain-containing protein [Deltaproteobacteria bacterium]
MTRTLLIAAMLLVAARAQAQGQQLWMDTPEGKVRVGVWGYEGAGGRFVEEEGDHRLVVQRDPYGRTRIKVLAPEGAVLHVFHEGREVYADEVPTVFDAAPDQRFRLQVVFGDGSIWTRHVQTRPGAVAKLWVSRGEVPRGPQTGPLVVTTTQAPPPPPPPPPGPTPMPADRFARLVQAIQGESFPQQQLSVLRTAAAHEFFTCDQVAQLVDLYSFPHDKVDAVKMTRSHILDPENGYTLSSHFDFPNDKQAVQKLFQ